MERKNNRRNDWFVHNRYWGTHDRTLLRMGGKVYPYQVDVSCTPINPDMKGGWEKLAEVRIRRHFTMQPHEAFSHSFPAWIEPKLVEVVGPRIAEIILHEDLMKQICEQKWQRVNKAWWQGGGLPFILVCKDPSRYLPLIEYWIKPGNMDAVPEDHRYLFDDVFEVLREWQTA